MEIPLLQEFVTVFSLSIGVIYICHKIKIPAIVGFLITGVLVGPYGFNLVDDIHAVEAMAEIGVVLLLFTIGMELSLSQLVRLKNPVFFGGGLQVFLTALVVFGIAALAGFKPGKAVFFGFLVALSSTAIVLKLLQDKAEMETPHGRISLSILIFQDLVIVPMVLLVPFLAGQGGDLGPALGIMALKVAGVLTILFVFSRWIVPRVLEAVVRTRSRELFLITTLAMCLAVAWMTSYAGLSLSLGAFLAGLIMSESEFSLSALEGVMPFRDVFTSIFFISIGMLLNAGFVWSNIGMVLAVTAGVLGIKFLLAGSVSFFIGYPLRPAILVGFALCQVGEFSFVLAKVGLEFDLISGSGYQLFLSASIISMTMTPLFMAIAPKVADFLIRLPVFSSLAARGSTLEQQHAQPCDSETCNHLIIVGYGVGGQNLSRAAKASKIPRVIVEMNPDTVRRASAEGENIFYGDATQTAVLEHARIHEARVLAVVIPDPAAVRRIVDAARRLNPALHIVARTRFVGEIEPLQDLGADDVIAEEFESSIEIFTRVLHKYLIPGSDIERLTSEIRAGGYRMLRTPDQSLTGLAELDSHFTDMEVAAFRVGPNSPLVGKTLLETNLRRRHGLTLVAIRRGEESIANPDGTFTLQPGDVAYIFGLHSLMGQAARLLTPEEKKDGSK